MHDEICEKSLIEPEMAATSEGVVPWAAVLAEDALRSQERMLGNATTIASIEGDGAYD
jgi:hypothetical protein